MKVDSKSLFEAISVWPRWQQSLLGVAVCALSTYYAAQIFFVFMGQPTAALYDFVGIAVTVSVLMVCGALGLLFRNPLIVGAILAGIGVCFLLQYALRSTGNPIGWVRQGLFYMAPLLNGWLLSRWLRAMRKASDLKVEGE